MHGGKLFSDVVAQNDLYLVLFMSHDTSPYKLHVNLSKTENGLNDSPRSEKHSMNFSLDIIKSYAFFFHLSWKALVESQPV